MMLSNMSAQAQTDKPQQGRIKCVIWDLDNTLWDGVLLEGAEIRIRPDIIRIIKIFDDRGILNSIASKNDYDAAMRQLKLFDLAEFFLQPQISWDAKSSSIDRIARLLNIGVDSLAFVDDQPFELEEVSFILPQVLCIDVREITRIADTAEFIPRFITDESKLRRAMYRSNFQRDEAEREFVGTSEEFLSTLGMVFTITRAGEEDLQRAEELTIRTNQLNSTGRTYSYDELNDFRQSPHHLLLVAALEDRFGFYGKIGLALVECNERVWTLRLLLISCRVMSRGVGTILLNHIMGLARADNARLQAEFLETGRNRMMYVTYKFAGFSEVSREKNIAILESDLSMIKDPPPYLTIQSE